MPYSPIPEGPVPEGHPCQEGDVIFLLNDGNTSTDSQSRPLRVSSHAISNASPVFKAMLNPRFTDKDNFSFADPLELDLPDDDCDAMIWMCFALHLQDLPEGRVPLELLKRLAILCDKYDCARAMQPWSRLWLYEWNEAAYIYDIQWELLWTSHLFQDHSTFWYASQELIYGKTLEDPSSEDGSPDAIGMSLLPTGLQDSIEKQKDRATVNLLNMLEQIKATYPATLDSCQTQRNWKRKLRHRLSLSNHFDKNLNRHGVSNHFDEELNRLGLVPASLVIEKEGVEMFLYKLRDFERGSAVDNVKCTTAGCKCGTIDTLQISNAEDNSLGLCLTCVKQSKFFSRRKSFCSMRSQKKCEDAVEARPVKKKPVNAANCGGSGTLESPVLLSDEESEPEVIEDENCMASCRRNHRRYLRIAELLG